MHCVKWHVRSFALDSKGFSSSFYWSLLPAYNETKLWMWELIYIIKRGSGSFSKILVLKCNEPVVILNIKLKEDF